MSSGVVDDVGVPSDMHVYTLEDGGWLEARSGQLGWMNGTERVDLAAEAGLHHVVPGGPGYRRARSGTGFSYLTHDGEHVSERVRQRIEVLVIPPAWEDVWISRDPLGHIQATGRDDAGRRQYIYHPLWEEIRDEGKFDRLEPFGHGLPRLRKQLDTDLRRHGLPRQRVVALAVAVLDRTLLRVGSRRYAHDNGSYGLTTLMCEHIEVDGLHVHLEFSGKGGAEHQSRFPGSTARRTGRPMSGAGRSDPLQLRERGGLLGSVPSSDVNAYLSDVLDGPFTAKDLRTWGASALVTGEVARNLDEPDPEARLWSAIDVAAEQLGNTRAVCRDSYVHPSVVQANSDGAMATVWRRARSGKWTGRDESALRLLLSRASE